LPAIHVAASLGRGTADQLASVILKYARDPEFKKATFLRGFFVNAGAGDKAEIS
jgi:hypothetical protein